MAVSKSLVLLLSVLAVAAAQSARVKKQVYLAGVHPYGAAVLGDDGSYWPGKYGPENIQVGPVAAPVVPGIAPYVAAPYAAPYAAAPYVAAPYVPLGGDDGSYWPGKYGPENIQVAH
ncbi:uncharacterized protein LOC124367872 [Homalodisca vitripennis]|nr:uncharacterized protein LOC124367872 [Homalodisca vitripennis]KAG8306895.1 hypothetical protein J6590_035973 [Homalodisca vitripennis]